MKVSQLNGLAFRTMTLLTRGSGNMSNVVLGALSGHFIFEF